MRPEAENLSRAEVKPVMEAEEVWSQDISAAAEIHAASERARRRLSLLGNLQGQGKKNRKAQRINQSFGELWGFKQLEKARCDLVKKVDMPDAAQLPEFMQLDPQMEPFDANQFDIWYHRCKLWYERWLVAEWLKLKQNSRTLEATGLDCREVLHLVAFSDCRELSSVKLTKSLITNEGLYHLAKTLGSKLTKLDLSGTRGFDDIGLKALAAHCPELQELRLADTKVTDEGLSKVAKWCPGLCLLEVDVSSDCRIGVTSQSLHLLSPECEIEQTLPVSDDRPGRTFTELGPRDEFDPLKELLTQRYLFEATQKTEWQPELKPKEEDAEAALVAEALDSWRQTRKWLRLFFDRQDVELTIMAIVLIYAVIILIDLSIDPIKIRSPPPPAPPPPMPPSIPNAPFYPPSMPPAYPPFQSPCDTDFQMFFLMDSCFLSFFMVELIARLVAWGVVFFLSEPINALDGLVVVTSFSMVIFLGVTTGVCEDPAQSTSSISQLVGMLRLVRLFRLMTIFNKVQRTRQSAHLMRKKVSHKRMGSPIERVLDILKREKAQCDVMAYRSKYDYIMDVIVSDKLYSVTVTQSDKVTAEMAGFLNNFSMQVTQLAQQVASESKKSARECEGGEKGKGEKGRGARARRRSIPLEGDDEVEWVDRLVETDAVARLLSEASEWHFDIFKLHELVGAKLMPVMVMHFIRAYSLDIQLKLNCPNMVRFLAKLSFGYNDVPFHNYIHACDVVQTTAFFLNCHKVLPHVDALDMLATLLAAAMHDHNHPGLTNIMLVNSRDQLALLYNDTSVLEMHHLASSWRIMLSPGLDPFEGFSASQFLELRSTIVQAVLGTDMKHHFEHLTKFKARSSIGGFDNSDRTEAQERHDQRLLLTCCLHAADVSNPLKPWPVCKQWASRVMAEFFNQGDLEAKLGLEMSPFMDRKKTDIAKCQVGFVNFVLRPFFEEWCAWLGEEVRAQLCGDMQENVERWEAEGEEALGAELLYAVKNFSKFYEARSDEPKPSGAETEVRRSSLRSSKLRWLAGGRQVSMLLKMSPEAAAFSRQSKRADGK